MDFERGGHSRTVDRPMFSELDTGSDGVAIHSLVSPDRAAPDVAVSPTLVVPLPAASSKSSP